VDVTDTLDTPPPRFDLDALAAGPTPVGAPDAGVTLRLTRDGAVAEIALARPEALNAQTPSTWAALREVRDGLPESVRVVVVRGEGRAFSAGLDRRLFTPEGVPGQPGIAALATVSPEQGAAQIAEYQASFGWLQTAPVTTIALVQGHAIGAGFQLALACDLRLVADDVSFCMAEAGLGIVPDLGGTQRLVDLVGYSRAVDLCLTVRRVGAEEALRTGLATAVVPTGGLDAALEPLLDALLAVPRGAAVATKQLLLAAAGEQNASQEARERAAQLARLHALLAGG
jgi:enoyl-CoA hydratase/carnithine racemase